MAYILYNALVTNIFLKMFPFLFHRSMGLKLHKGEQMISLNELSLQKNVIDSLKTVLTVKENSALAVLPDICKIYVCRCIFL